MKKIKQLGQSTIEFIMTFSLVVGFVFLFFKTSLNYTDGYMVHFATFMAARSYMVLDPNRWNNADEGDTPSFNYAKTTVFNKYFGGIINNFNGEVKQNSPSTTKFTPFIGLYTNFREKFSTGYIGGTDVLEFRSEAFLGREPTRVEVYEQICTAIGDIADRVCNVESTLDDNGG